MASLNLQMIKLRMILMMTMTRKILATVPVVLTVVLQRRRHRRSAYLLSIPISDIWKVKCFAFA